MSLRSFIRRRDQIEIAQLQDQVVYVILRLMRPPPIFHGGTVIWRVFKSPRFSEDLDIFHAKIEPRFKNEFREEIQVLGLVLRKFKMTENMVFSVVGNRVQARLEILRRGPKLEPVDAEYETMDGSFIVVKVLPPRELLKEKVRAYLGRRKAKDLYDVYYLLNHVNTLEVGRELKQLAESLNSPPGDWGGLRVLILRGLPPTFESVRKKIEGVAR